MTDSQYSVVLVRSVSHALRSEKLLQRAGVSCKLIPVPRHLSSDCGVSVRIETADLEQALRALEGGSLDVEGVHQI
jgi:hypothetical protein